MNATPCRTVTYSYASAYSLSLRYSVRSPIPKTSAAWRRLPLVSRSAASMAALSTSAIVMPGRYSTSASHAGSASTRVLGLSAHPGPTRPPQRPPPPARADVARSVVGPGPAIGAQHPRRPDEFAHVADVTRPVGVH